VTIEPDDSNALQLERMYRPPAAENTPLPRPTPNGDFYVVSPTKFLVLFFATFGGYQMYWFFANWRRYRDRTRRPLSPVWRAVFSPFFAHKLFGIVAEQGARVSPTAPRLESNGMATLYVALVIGSWLIDHMGDNPVLDVAAAVLGLGAAYPLLAAQQAANAASGDRDGSSNSRLTPLNYVFILFGALLWPLFVLGLLAPRTQ